MGKLILAKWLDQPNVLLLQDTKSFVSLYDTKENLLVLTFGEWLKDYLALNDLFANW